MKGQISEEMKIILNDEFGRKQVMEFMCNGKKESDIILSNGSTYKISRVPIKHKTDKKESFLEKILDYFKK